MLNVFEFAKVLIDKNIQQAVVHKYIRGNLKMCAIVGGITDSYLNGIIWTRIFVIKRDFEPGGFKGKERE